MLYTLWPVTIYTLKEGDVPVRYIIPDNAGAAYGVYWGGKLIGTYTTNAAGQFTINYYSYGDNWSICEIAPSGGYLLDTALPAAEYNSIICAGNTSF